MNDYLELHESYLAHFKTKGAKNGLRRYQSYVVAPTKSGMVGEEVGEAAKQRARLDKKDYKQARREVYAATKNAQRIATSADAASQNLNAATAAYNNELGKFRISRRKKSENLTALDQQLTSAKEQYRNATDEFNRAKAILSDRNKRYIKAAGKSMKDIKPKTVDAGKRTLGMILTGKHTEFQLDTYKTGLNAYRTTAIGRAAGRRNVNAEMDRRRRSEQSMNKRY